ncbi:MAG: hypothetical protein LLG01_10320 [Planctomycetaceae bacterium]|nr:hypothetical protein [Planctomycetaceae bacterium]
MQRLDTLPEDDQLPQGADRKTRVAVLVIFLGLANFMLFTVGYVIVGGEAINGRVRSDADGSVHYYLKSAVSGGPDGGDIMPERSRAVFIYSAVHSISIWPTVGMVMLAMLALAKDRIVSAMHSTIVRGRTFITILATVIVLAVILATIVFIGQFVDLLSRPEPFQATTRAVACGTALPGCGAIVSALGHRLESLCHVATAWL